MKGSFLCMVVAAAIVLCVLSIVSFLLGGTL